VGPVGPVAVLVGPVIPVGPVGPVLPVGPVTEPTGPVLPVGPVGPVAPVTLLTYSQDKSPLPELYKTWPLRPLVLGHTTTSVLTVFGLAEIVVPTLLLNGRSLGISVNAWVFNELDL
jgi:hypothetical protein